MNDSEVLALLLDLLEHTRIQCVQAAVALRLPPFVVTERRLQTAEDASRSTGRFESVQVSPACFPDLARQLADQVRTASNHNERRADVAKALHAHYGERCRVWPTTWPVDFGEDPIGSISRVTLGPMQSEYLRRLKSLEQQESNEARACAESVIDLLKSDFRYHVTWLPVGGIRFAEDAVAVGEVAFVKLTPIDLGDLFDAGEHFRRPRMSAHPMFSFSHSGYVERYALVIRDRCNKAEQPIASSLARRVIAALQVLGYDLSGVGMAHTTAVPGFADRFGGQRFRLRPSGSDRECSEDQLRKALTLATAMPESAFAKPFDALDIALHRFGLGAVEESHSEALLDYTIAMEAILLPGIREELSFRFALHGSRLLADDSATRRNLFDRLQVIYHARSGLVHGGAPKRDEIARVCSEARDLCASLLRRAIMEGCPTKSDYRQLCLT